MENQKKLSNEIPLIINIKNTQNLPNSVIYSNNQKSSSIQINSNNTNEKKENKIKNEIKTNKNELILNKNEIKIKQPPIIPPYIYKSHKPGGKILENIPIPNFHDIKDLDNPIITPNTSDSLVAGPDIPHFSLKKKIELPEKLEIKINKPPIIPPYVFYAHNMEHPQKPKDVPPISNFYDLARKQHLIN